MKRMACWYDAYMMVDDVGILDTYERLTDRMLARTAGQDHGPGGPNLLHEQTL